MQLTGLILFCGALILLIMWSYKMFRILKHKHLLKYAEDELMAEYMKGAVLYITVAISAGIVWG